MQYVMFVAGWLLASATSSAQFTGSFSGTGRSCSGKLQVNSKTITWETPFSQCQKVPYEILEQSQQANERRFLYQLKQPNKKCLYKVLYLYHRDSPNLDIDWHVIGYTVDSPNALSCYLVKE